MEFLGHMISLFLTFQGTAKLFFQVVIPFNITCQQWYRVSIFPYSHQHFLPSFFFIIAILIEWEVVSHCSFGFQLPDYLCC